MTDPNQPQFPAAAPVVGQPAADVQDPQVGEGNQITYIYPSRQPEEDFNDFQVGVRASLLKRCRGRLQTVAIQGFPLPELLLGVSTLTAGAALSAVISGVQLGSWRGVEHQGRALSVTGKEEGRTARPPGQTQWSGGDGRIVNTTRGHGAPVDITERVPPELGNLAGERAIPTCPQRRIPRVSGQERRRTGDILNR